MHLGKFHYVLDVVDRSVRSARIADHLNNVINSLQAIANDPANTNLVQAFNSALEEFRGACETLGAKHTYPSFHEYLKELGAASYFGGRLFRRVKTIIEKNQLHPTHTVLALQKFRDSLVTYYENLKVVNKLLGDWEIEYQRLDPGENELGICVPVEECTKTLADLSKLAKEWDFALRPFVELYDPQHEPFKIRTLTSSDWQIYLTATPFVLGAISLALRQINGILNQLIASKKLLKDLIGIDPAVVAPVINAVDGQLDTELKRVAAEIVKDKPTGDTGRDNEIEIQLVRGLRFLAAQLGNDVKIDIRVIPVEVPDVPQAGDAVDPSNIEEIARLTEQHNEQARIAADIERNMDMPQLTGDAKELLALAYDLGDSE